MLSDATKNAFSAIFPSDNLQLITAVPESGVVFIGDSTRIFEVAIMDEPEEDISITVVLPNKSEGKRIRIINSSAYSELYSYTLNIGVVISGSVELLDVPAMNSRLQAYLGVAGFSVEDGEWIPAGKTLNDSVNIIWSMTKAGDILWFGGVFLDIALLYAAEEYETPPDCAYIVIDATENVESHELAITLSQDFRAINRIITIDLNLDGTQKDTMDIIIAEGLTISDVPNGIHSFRCIGDFSLGVLYWLPLTLEVV